MAKDKRLYMVLTLQTKIETVHSGQKIKLRGCAGFVPVFDSMKKAEKLAGEKFDILPITIHKPKNHVRTS